MALPSFLVGILVLLYLSTFVLFAIIRVLTGISISRVGYFSLRRLAYTPCEGFKIECRGLGLHVHRPTFAQPTWISLVANELIVTVNVEKLDASQANGRNVEDGTSNSFDSDGLDSSAKTTRTKFPPIWRDGSVTWRSKTWRRLNTIKEIIERLHRQLSWLRMVDVVAANSTINVVGVGNIQVGSCTAAVDTRRKMIDRVRFFWRNRKKQRGRERQAEWIITVNSMLFTADGRDSLEIIDGAILNVHGFLYAALDGLRDASVALKLGRIHIPFDDFSHSFQKYKALRAHLNRVHAGKNSIDATVDRVIQELDPPESTDQELMQAVSDSKEFVSSLLRGIKEVQLACTFVGFTKRIRNIKTSGPAVLLNASMKEVGIDLHQLDPKSPAHRMYFSSKDIAHEALVAALSISLGIEEVHGKLDRLLYIPMVTTTVRTTLPSKTVELVDQGTPEQRNANILFANAVVTSPSVDVDPRHLPLLLAMLQRKPEPLKTRQQQQRHMLIFRLLPKANVKFSMLEPVVRIALPPVDKTVDPEEFDLIISSISSVSLDMDSFHSAIEEMHYSLGSTVRVQTHSLYYQTCAGARFDLLETETFDLKVQVIAAPDVQVMATGSLQTFTVKMVRQEIADGLRQIVHQLRLNVEPDKRARATMPAHFNFLRALPVWLLHFQMQCSDCSFEVAGVDEGVSQTARGLAIQVESWSVEYMAQRLEGYHQRQPSRRRASSRSLVPDADFLKAVPMPARKKHRHEGDGRRSSVHVRGLEAFIIESPEKWEMESFVNMPRFEMDLSTTSDNRGRLFQIQSHIRTLLFQYSLYRHYAVGVAITVLRKAFLRTGKDASYASPRTPPQPHHPVMGHSPPPVDGSPDQFLSDEGPSRLMPELVTFNLKAAMIQIKATMPSDPPVMLHIHGMEAGRHRWAPSYVQAKLLRFYAEAPRMRRFWARMVTIKHGRLDYRVSKRKMSAGGYQDERIFDVVTQAVRIAVPHEMIVHEIADNITNTIKTVQQLHHRFQTGTNEYILGKRPEGPKIVPWVSLRSRTLMFELEDGAFEWKLGLIYRVGRVEQIQRQAREEAFRMKAKRIREDEVRRESCKYRARSVNPRGRSHTPNVAATRSQSSDALRNRPSLESTTQDRSPRYDPEGDCPSMSGVAHVSVAEAKQRLEVHNARSWKMRIDRHLMLARKSMEELRAAFWGSDDVPEDMDDSETILEIPLRPALMSTMIHDLHLVIDKPSFPMRHLPDFMRQVGKGMPRDMKYSLLVPMNIQIEMGEVRITLRDYPLPLLHVPGLKPGQSSRLPVLSLKTDFVLAEEFRGAESTRQIEVEVVPPPDPKTSNEGRFAIDVRRTVGPVKSFTNVSVNVNTANPTRVTWGPSYQPAIQDMMMAIESLTRPQLDPSDRVGFWDKIRLNVHSRVRVEWRGDGDVHLALKGTRDPYNITGNGAGFLMCWRNDVKWSVHSDDDPKRFMTVDSNEYVLAIPDYGHHVREQRRREVEEDFIISDPGPKTGAAFRKVVMKLSGKVQWLAGLVFEQAIENGKRSFEFKPHYQVVLKTPQHAKPGEDGLPYDAFRGFRSQHIHLSIAVRAPVDREWKAATPQPSRSYNTVHLTPRFFTHFYAWWSLFGGALSLPIRQGSLFPGHEKNSKKFGRHLATIKYNLLLAPLFLSHIYKHRDIDDLSDDSVSATGIKVRFDSWMLDLHQRREEFNTRNLNFKSHGRTSGMKIHAGQLDLVSADIRAVSATIRGATADSTQQTSLPASTADDVDLSRFTIPDNDFNWIDMDDFVELDWILPTEPNPDTKILPLVYAPRITYFRQTDVGGMISGDPERTSPFGQEPTHFCIMSHDDDPRRFQSSLIRRRLEKLDQQLERHADELNVMSYRMQQADETPENLETSFETLSRHTGVLREKRRFMENMLRHMTDDGDDQSGSITDVSEVASVATDAAAEPSISGPMTPEFASDFKNRFVVHNMQLKWNNTLRNVILRYIHQVSQRRGFVYYLSRPAVKFILDIVEEQAKPKANTRGAPANSNSGGANQSPKPIPGDREKDKAVDEEVWHFLEKGRKFVNADNATNPEARVPAAMDDLASGIADGFAPQNSYHVHLVAPQIQLQSDKNKKHVVLITAKGMELKVVEVLDKERLSDNVSGLVQRRFMVNMDSTQFFVTHQKWFSTQLLSMYAGSHYGAPSGSAWPPWVPMEVMFDFNTDPFGFKRVVQKTSAMLRYDKYNTLRLKYNDEVNTGEGAKLTSAEAESRMDNLWVDFPQARALCNSSQYYAMYVIVLDLLMYNEPLEKTRNERLEKIMLASDFSDLRGAPEMVTRLQERVRQLEDIKTHFQTHTDHLDAEGWADRQALEKDLALCEDELFFMMKAITTSQRKFDTTASNALLKWSITAKEIVWHLIRDNNQPLVELQLKDVGYDRTDNADGSHINLVQVGAIRGLNLLPDAIYPDMIAPYLDAAKYKRDHDASSQPMIRVYWNMLEAIAGIPVMGHFEVNLVPMKIQLEREVGKKLFEYIFPGMDEDFLSKVGNDRPPKNDSPFMVKHSPEHDDNDDEASLSGTNGSLRGTDNESIFTARAASLEQRLRPTLNSEMKSSPSKVKSIKIHSSEGNAFRFFRANNARGLGKKASYESLRAGTVRSGVGRASAGFPSPNGKTGGGEAKKGSTRFGLRTRSNGDRSKHQQQSDDLTKMMDRASNYMTIAYIKVPSVVLCLSYKGKGDRNLEDVHAFVFRLPTIQWRNKTWSNLDLALALKSRVIKALISHTGAIIGNKFSRHRPNTAQQSRLRELATSSVLLTPQVCEARETSGDDSSSVCGNGGNSGPTNCSPVDFSRSPPRSLRESANSVMGRHSSESRSSSIASSARSQSVPPPHPLATSSSPAPSFLMMTTQPLTSQVASGSDLPEKDSGTRGFGLSLHRPGSSSSTRLSTFSSHSGRAFRPSTSGTISSSRSLQGFSRLEPPTEMIDRRHSTSSGTCADGGSGLLQKLNALTHRLKDLEHSVPAERRRSSASTTAAAAAAAEEGKEEERQGGQRPSTSLGQQPHSDGAAGTLVKKKWQRGSRMQMG